MCEVEYGNGGKVHYEYDEFDRTTGVRHDEETAPRYEYEYGPHGEVGRIHDHHLGRVHEVQHDLSGRPIVSTQKSGNTVLYRATMEYDDCHVVDCSHSDCAGRMKNNLTRFKEEVNGSVYNTNYDYDKDDRITQVQYDGTAHRVDYAYDGFGRLNTRKVYNGNASTPILSSQYTYNAGGFTQDGKTFSSNQVQKIEQEHIAFTYEYDEVGNIVSEVREYKNTNPSTVKTTTYAYDALGQLIRVNDQNDTTSGEGGTTWTYLYDRGGNILSKSRYAYAASGTSVGTALETIPYSYGDVNWKDKLTAYNGTTITYDAIGNPLNDGTWAYTWTAGRQLAQMSKSGTTVQFKYDHNGIRSQKTVTENGVTTTTDYTYHGKLLAAMTRGSDVLRFEYDALSRPTVVMHNGIRYVYLHDIQSDIVGIMDTNGNLVVEYRYDAWGKPLSITGSMAGTLGEINPFRYRGYVYDEETGLYYLRERQYDSMLCRFVNEDLLLGTISKLFEHNTYIYCRNEPVQHYDDTGFKCEKCESGVATGYFVFRMNKSEFNILMCWLTGEYSWENPEHPLHEAVGNILGIGAECAVEYMIENIELLKNLPGISLAYNIVKGLVEPFVSYERKSGVAFVNTLSTKFSCCSEQIDTIEIVLSFSGAAEEYMVSFYKDGRKVEGMEKPESASSNALSNIYLGMLEYFPVYEHGHFEHHLDTLIHVRK